MDPTTEPYLLRLLLAVASTNAEYVLLAAIVIAGLIILKSFYSSSLAKRRDSGVTNNSTLVSVDGSKSLPVKLYVSEMQGLAGKPDALISEFGCIIPIERKPLARKIRDRYVAQILVYMRLVEEFEGKKPPYGYLILGPTCRRFKIDNTPERQDWLQKLIDEMQGILQGGPCIPAPHPKKCSRCDVREACKFRM